MSAEGEDTGTTLAGLRSRWPVVVVIIGMWIALWEKLSIANLLGGAVVAVVALVVARSVKPGPVHHLSPRAALLYLRTFSRQLIVANWEVIKAVIRPDTIRPGIVAMPLQHTSDAVVTLVGNSITLTPGTLTLETERRGDTAILYVHALDLSDEDGVREDISELEKLAVDAFAGPEAQASQARTLEELEQGRGAASSAAHPADLADAADADGAPADTAPADRAPADTAPGDRAPADRASVDRAPVDRATAAGRDAADADDEAAGTDEAADADDEAAGTAEAGDDPDAAAGEEDPA